MEKLQLIVNHGVVYADSRKVAEMIGKRHKNLVRDIGGYIDAMSTELKIEPSDFFIKTSYRDASGKSNTRYDLTKQGCEMVANKLTGKKGILFTATYVQQFNDMENQLKGNVVKLPVDPAPDDRPKKEDIQAMRAEAMLRNAKARQVNILLKLAERTNVSNYRDIMTVKAANMAIGIDLLPLPRATDRPRHNLGYFCKLIGKAETWASQLGKQLKMAGVEKLDGITGEWVEDKAKYNDSQRKNFEWYDDFILPQLKKLFGDNLKAGALE